MSKPLILVSNDDGIQAAGLKALCEAMQSLGEVVVMAPDVERSAVGHAITISDPLRVTAVDLGLAGVTAQACSGTPADCIKLAVLSVLPRRPDLIVSGINHGSNTGINVIYSGTVSAATEGSILGIPSVALSIDSWEPTDLEPAKVIAQQVAKEVLDRGLPKGTLLNVNIPIPRDEQPSPGRNDQPDYDVTVHGKSDWQDEFDHWTDPYKRTYYRLTGTKRDMEEAPNTDEESLKAGKVTITPLQYDLTDYRFLEDLVQWDLFKPA